MKKILIATNLVLLFIVIFQSCSKKNFPSSNTGHTVNNPGTFCEDSACLGYDETESLGMIDFETAQMLANNYAADKEKKYVWKDGVNTDSLDARNIWFDLKKVKNFIGLIESSLCKAGCEKKDGYGIRIYYAKYPDKTTMRESNYLNTVEPLYANRHAVFMIPTYWDSEKKANIDFDPTSTAANCILPPYKTSSSQGKGKPVIMLISTETGPDGQNHGGLKPPFGEGNFPTVE